MKKISLIVSLPTLENDYQQQQAKEAELVGAQLGVAVRVIDAHNDSITQSLDLLKIIQAKLEARPDAARCVGCQGKQARRRRLSLVGADHQLHAEGLVGPGFLDVRAETGADQPGHRGRVLPEHPADHGLG